MTQYFTPLFIFGAMLWTVAGQASIRVSCVPNYGSPNPSRYAAIADVESNGRLKNIDLYDLKDGRMAYDSTRDISIAEPSGSPWPDPMGNGRLWYGIEGDQPTLPMQVYLYLLLPESFETGPYSITTLLRSLYVHPDPKDPDHLPPLREIEDYAVQCNLLRPLSSGR